MPDHGGDITEPPARLVQVGPYTHFLSISRMREGRHGEAKSNYPRSHASCDQRPNKIEPSRFSLLWSDCSVRLFTSHSKKQRLGGGGCRVWTRGRMVKRSVCVVQRTRELLRVNERGNRGRL